MYVCGQVCARNGTPLCSVPNMYMYTMHTYVTLPSDAGQSGMPHITRNASYNMV